ncbi:MAG: hypothetical protein Q7R97_00835 [Candidatus Daviesbacteria bacterium]|nr:hypothetical protein [Candidatus Daviesbacteria bacterium]
MNVAIISPTAYLNELSCYRKNSYHMVLAQRVLEDEHYANFYNLYKGFTILDNGACELKRSIHFEALLKVIELIHPNVAVLPDILGDSEATLKLSNLFLNKISQKDCENLIFMGVCQGQTKKEWLTSFNFFAKHDKVKMIGISNTEAMFKADKNTFSRVQTLKYLLDHNLLPQNKKIHLLGLPDSGHLELFKMKQYNCVEGVDTSAPVVHGTAGISFKENLSYKKIRQYLDSATILNKRQIALIKQNIDVLFVSSGYLL